MDKPTPALSRRLSGMDSAFLYLERKEIPLNIAAVALFDGPLPFREFVANIESKLDLLPRYRQIPVPPPFGLGYPTWEDDTDFDIRRHMIRVRLPAPGSEAELEALAGRLLSQTLDRGKPLWEIHVVEGLKDGRGALIVRIHHALADGVAGAALFRIMLDSTPEASRATPRPRRRAAVRPRPQPTLAEQISTAVQSALENAVAAEAGLLSLADGLLSERGQEALHTLTGLLPELLLTPERFPFNKPCSGDRKFCWTEVDFEHVRAIRAAVGGKVNDCVLSVVVRAIARYIRLHGEPVKGRFLRVVCPVNVRGDEQGESLGNRITFLPVTLPLDVSDPVEMLHAVSNRMEVMKSVGAAEMVAIFASCLGAAPAPMQELFWRGLPLVPLPLPLLNIICTNVPGSPTPLYTVGRRLLASYPQVPTGYELGVAVAVQSYDGKLFFGLTADAHVAPDVGRLRDYIRTAFRELCRAAGVKLAKPGRARTARQAAAPAGAAAGSTPAATAKLARKSSVEVPPRAAVAEASAEIAPRAARDPQRAAASRSARETSLQISPPAAVAEVPAEIAPHSVRETKPAAAAKLARKSSVEVPSPAAVKAAAPLVSTRAAEMSGAAEEPTAAAKPSPEIPLVAPLEPAAVATPLQSEMVAETEAVLV